MATSKKPAGVVRVIAPLAPLALALLMQNAVVPGAGGKPSAAATTHGAEAVKCEEVENMRECHTDYPTGCSDSARYDAYVNLLKNTLSPPPPTSAFRYLSKLKDYADLEAGTPKEVGKSNHADFKDKLGALGEGQTMGLIGYLYYIKQTGAESSNCELTGDDDVDYHIGIGFDPAVAAVLAAHKKLGADDAKQLTHTSVIVEITPHYRAFKQPNWSLDVIKAVLGRQVRLTGQLMLDSEHNNPLQNCGFPGAGDKCWRASAWELHPVTQFQVCRADKCEPDSKDWVEVEKADEPPPAAAAKPTQ